MPKEANDPGGLGYRVFKAGHLHNPGEGPLIESLD